MRVVENGGGGGGGGRDVVGVLIKSRGTYIHRQVPYFVTSKNVSSLFRYMHIHTHGYIRAVRNYYRCYVNGRPTTHLCTSLTTGEEEEEGESGKGVSRCRNR